MVRSGCLLFGGSLRSVPDLAAFNLVATGTVGTLELVLDPANTFYALGGTIQQTFSGTTTLHSDDVISFASFPNLAGDLEGHAASRALTGHSHHVSASSDRRAGSNTNPS